MLSNAVLLDERVTFLSSSEGWTVTHAHGPVACPLWMVGRAVQHALALREDGERANREQDG